MRVWLACVLTTLLLAVPSGAAEGADAADATDSADKGGVQSTRADEEVVVYGDLFARWKDTRWSIATEVQVPGFMVLAATRNHQMRVPAFQIRTVLACEKSWRLNRRKIEASCFLEDFGLQAVLVHPDYKHAQRVLDEIDAKLTGARLQLQVKDNGRVVNIDIEGLPRPRNRRERRIQEMLRLLMSRVVVGYDMKLRKSNFLRTGQWVEYRSGLLSMPAFQPPGAEMPAGGVALPKVGTATPASGLIVHQLNGYRGHVVVQTKGEGQIQDELGVNYVADLTGVSVYDEDNGFMTERVWSLTAKRTAESFGEWGTSIVDYAHSGRLRMLGDDEVVDVGPTRVVLIQGQEADTVSATWEPVRP